jgi:hypothetical protein
VPSLGTREVFAFGEGVALPVRLTFAELPQDLLPNSEALGSARAEDGSIGVDFIASVVERWRGAMMSQKMHGGYEAEQPGPDRVAAIPPPPLVEPDRPSLLKRPISAVAGAPAPSGAARIAAAAMPRWQQR